ncbi:hypothetical protein F4813DRAFT_154282 [Daldinia decipiens]|uniref:uncharacterized protein n=1 Tax=Daldinia decipiens TaxID=326647 RepID=UPI0020C54B88|nr:uncharacterized protein F4813DRAFT_154282 [Daldinia decipiens]KAI1655800.1 hypothetical protein F4813DRAFT_154282 [Daldinia decipiens]
MHTCRPWNGRGISKDQQRPAFSASPAVDLILGLLVVRQYYFIFIFCLYVCLFVCLFLSVTFRTPRGVRVFVCRRVGFSRMSDYMRFQKVSKKFRIDLFFAPAPSTLLCPPLLFFLSRSLLSVLSLAQEVAHEVHPSVCVCMCVCVYTM